MAIRRIRLLGEPVLRRKCRHVRSSADRSVQSAIRDLRDTLGDFRRRRGFGRGIAAPQIGISLRVIYIDFKYRGALINPRIKSRSKTSFRLWDDCFSFPDILVRLRRRSEVDVSFIDEDGVSRSIKARGPLSELLQHEIDHLDGILAVDRSESITDIIYRGASGQRRNR